MTNGGAGTLDRVPDVNYGHTQMVPTDNILLRLIAGFKEKSDKFLKYLENGIVGPDDKLVIAIDLSGVSHAVAAEDEQVPLLCKALLGIGQLTMSFLSR